MNVNPRATAPDVVRMKAIISKYIDLNHGVGLEVGPFDRPFFLKNETNVSYLDYKTTEEARSLAMAADGHSPDWVVDIDYVVPESGNWSAVPDKGFDWILSSHALEHAPNLIGFLNTMAKKLKPGGLIISMLPDKRRTFDAYRPLTTLGRIIEDYLLDAKHTSIASVFDHNYYTRSLGIEEAEIANISSVKTLIYDGDARACFEEAKRSIEKYKDVHNYVFSDESFINIINGVLECGLISLDTVMHMPTERGEMTFLNILKVR